MYCNSSGSGRALFVADEERFGRSGAAGLCEQLGEHALVAAAQVERLGPSQEVKR